MIVVDRVDIAATSGSDGVLVTVDYDMDEVDGSLPIAAARKALASAMAADGGGFAPLIIARTSGRAMHTKKWIGLLET